MALALSDLSERDDWPASGVRKAVSGLQLVLSDCLCRESCRLIWHGRNDVDESNAAASLYGALVWRYRANLGMPIASRRRRRVNATAQVKIDRSIQERVVESVVVTSHHERAREPAQGHRRERIDCRSGQRLGRIEARCYCDVQDIEVLIASSNACGVPCYFADACPAPKRCSI